MQRSSLYPSCLNAALDVHLLYTMPRKVINKDKKITKTCWEVQKRSWARKRGRGSFPPDPRPLKYLVNRQSVRNQETHRIKTFFYLIHKESIFLSCPTVMFLVQVLLISSDPMRVSFQWEGRTFFFLLKSQKCTMEEKYFLFNSNSHIDAPNGFISLASTHECKLMYIS